MNLNLKKIDFKSPRVQIVIGVLLVTILAAFLWYQFIITPKDEKVKTLKIQYKEKQNKLNNIYAMKPQLKKLRETVNSLNKELDSLRSIFPDEKEIPKLIKEITRVGSKAGIYTIKFNPLPDSTREYYVENNYFMSVIGSYHGLAAFFNYLAEFDLIINLTKVNIKTNPSIQPSILKYEEHGETIQSIIATFNLTTFSSKK